ncbi:hypothetical protein, partial [Aeromonas veronii]|uniref:hypothetical protein n=1 Tax=Aeromonas veronii TaxID=654 RepID=UPI003D1A9339
MAFIAARLSTRLRCLPSGWLVLCSGSNGSIFAQSSSLISQLSPAIRPSEIVTQHYFCLTTPFGIGSKRVLSLANATLGVIESGSLAIHAIG